MNAVIKQIVAWFNSKGGFAHVMAGCFSAAILAYNEVPSFKSLCDSVYGTIPVWTHAWILAGLGLYTWYKTNVRTLPK